jgi:predicted dehydrogenase
LFSDEILASSHPGEQPRPVPIPPTEERLHSTDAEFVAAIRDGVPVSPDFQDGLRYMQFAEAVALSAKTGTAVTVPPPASMRCWNRFLDE